MKNLFLIIPAVICLSGYAQGQYANTKDDANSITYTDKGAKYHLISIGDKLPELFVNEKEVPREQLNSYAAIIDKLQNQLWERQKKQAHKADQENEEQINSIVNDLVSQKVISSANALTSFRLDNSGFIVNGQKQSFATYRLLF